MEKILLICGLLVCLCACHNKNDMTEAEIKLINNGRTETPYSVLTTDNEQDYLFLRKQCADIDISDIKENKNLQFFIERLKKTLIAESGVGIAAPQVGLGRNLFLFTRIDKPGDPVQVAINPKITGHSANVVCFEKDGCLSIPNVSGNSIRYEWVDVEYYDETGNLIKERLSGHSRYADFTGVIFQHEFDHLQGILFIDKLCE